MAAPLASPASVFVALSVVFAQSVVVSSLRGEGLSTLSNDGVCSSNDEVGMSEEGRAEESGEHHGQDEGEADQTGERCRPRQSSVPRD